jgi:hypothetical protein
MTAFQSFDELYPGRFLKAGLFNGQPATFTIKDIAREELEGEKGPEPKIVMSFAETPQPLVLAKVNAVAIKAMFGPQVTEWIGKRVTFYGTTTIMPLPTRKDEPCIRVWGSPDIDEEIRCEWTPPRKRKLVQTLKPVISATLQAALAKVEAATAAADLEAIMARAAQLTEAGKLSPAEFAKIGAAIDSRSTELARAPEGEQSPLPEAPEPAEQPDPTDADPEAEPAPEAPEPPKPLTLAAKRALLKQIESLPTEQQAAVLSGFAKRFEAKPGVTIANAITSQEHAAYLAEIIAGTGASGPSD